MNINESEELLMKLREICLKLGWDMAMDEGQDNVKGMIIGKEEFIENIVNEYEDFDEYVVYSPTQTENGTLQ